MSKLFTGDAVQLEQELNEAVQNTLQEAKNYSKAVQEVEKLFESDKYKSITLPYTKDELIDYVNDRWHELQNGLRC
jgi:gamma-glutamyl phosphate reductase